MMIFKIKRMKKDAAMLIRLQQHLANQHGSDHNGNLWKL